MEAVVPEGVAARAALKRARRDPRIVVSGNERHDRARKVMHKFCAVTPSFFGWRVRVVRATTYVVYIMDRTFNLCASVFHARDITSSPHS